ncbi:MAG: WhiB family transcriptional regulator [Acidimicrobiales bacterium]
MGVADYCSKIAPDDIAELAVLSDLLGRPAWHRYAACRGQGPSTFFRDDSKEPVDAKAVCAGCSVRAQCLADALSNTARISGVWGGTTLEERRQMVRSRAPRRRTYLK